jgi:hypothetical protein
MLSTYLGIGTLYVQCKHVKVHRGTNSYVFTPLELRRDECFPSFPFVLVYSLWGIGIELRNHNP